jgi:hypothetical protein
MALRYNSPLQKWFFDKNNQRWSLWTDPKRPLKVIRIKSNMKKINVVLARLLQFVVFVIFTFTVIAYFGAFILLPLDAIVLLIKLLGLFGLHGFIGALVAVPTVGYLSLIVYNTPGLCKLVIDTGFELVKTGKVKIEAFNDIVDALPQN